MSKNRYWIVKYRWRRGGEDWHHDNTVLDEHPVQWLVTRVLAGEEAHVLDWYREIRQEMYEEVKERTGLG